MKHRSFMEIAKIIASESKCVSLHVGAIIVKDDHILSHGYNGTPMGFPNCCDVINKTVAREHHHDWSNRNEIHAEQNAIIFAAKHGLSILGATMYVTHSPCHTCSKLIAQSGIKTVIYDEVYHRNDEAWSSMLMECGIEVISINELGDLKTKK